MEAAPCTTTERQRVAHWLVFTAFTSDYQLGHLTMPFNKAYAERHGYAFDCRIRVPYDWKAPGQRHPSWDKVAILLQLLDAILDGPTSDAGSTPTHILWIDADAVVVRQEVSLDDLWRGVPSTCELLLGEDIGPACLVNAGCFTVRVSEWSRQLWREVYSCAAADHFATKLYWEQSVLHVVLGRRGEGLEAVKPFWSYMGGPPGLKVFPHVCVLPRHAFNTNRGDFRASHGDNHGGGSGGLADNKHACEFIFHAAAQPTIIISKGNTWKPSKRQAIRAMLIQSGLLAPEPGEALDGSLNARGPRAPPRACRPTPHSMACRYPGRIAN